MLNRIFTKYKNNTWVYLAMAVAIAVLIITWWAVSDSLSLISNTLSVDDTGIAEESGAGKTVSPAIASTDQGYEIDELKDTLRDLNETARMLMDSITYLESKLIRAHVLSDALNGEQKASVA